MLILGGSATVTDLTGMNTIAVSSQFSEALIEELNISPKACFLIPIGVSIYVVVGGMRSTLLCD